MSRSWTEVASSSGLLAAFLIVGCESGESTATPTWHQHIAPLVAEKCGSCHVSGGIAPFSLETYTTAQPLASAMAAAVERGSMPPFLAQDTDSCQPRLPWRDDQRLTDAEKAMLRAWADAGAPEGEATNAAKVVFPDKPVLPREDVVMTVPGPIEVGGTRDLHYCMVVDPQLTEDVYVTGRLITSGNTRVLHHVVSYLIEPPRDATGAYVGDKAAIEAAIRAEKGVGIGEYYNCFGGPGLDFQGTATVTMLDAWAPGGLPNLAPDESGQPMNRNALVLMDVHYHPTGGAIEMDDSTKLALTTTTVAPRYISQVTLLGNFAQAEQTFAPFGVGRLLTQPGESNPEFMIPAGAAGHVEEMTWTWSFGIGEGLRVPSMGTHMHYVGRDMQVTLEHAAPLNGLPEQECLIQTPSWDFNWQRGYAFDAPYEDLPLMRPGDTLRMRCVFENNMDNRFVVDALDQQNLDAPVQVNLGEDTLDEMCLAAVGIMFPNAAYAGAP